MIRPVSEPNHVAVDLYKGEVRMVNGLEHVTTKRNEIRVIAPNGQAVLSMWQADQDALDLAWVIAKALDACLCARWIQRSWTGW